MRRDSIINEEIPKTEPKPIVAEAEPEKPENVKIESAKPELVAEEIEIENQNGLNNVEDDLGIKAEALYDYQAGSKKCIFIFT